MRPRLDADQTAAAWLAPNPPTPAAGFRPRATATPGQSPWFRHTQAADGTGARLRSRRRNPAFPDFCGVRTCDLTSIKSLLARSRFNGKTSRDREAGLPLLSIAFPESQRKAPPIMDEYSDALLAETPKAEVCAFGNMTLVPDEYESCPRHFRQLGACGALSQWPVSLRVSIGP
jgi:hypothetical protein